MAGTFVVKKANERVVDDAVSAVTRLEAKINIAILETKFLVKAPYFVEYISGYRQAGTCHREIIPIPINRTEKATLMFLRLLSKDVVRPRLKSHDTSMLDRSIRVE
jgi:hypothetical protein